MKRIMRKKKFNRRLRNENVAFGKSIEKTFHEGGKEKMRFIFITIGFSLLSVVLYSMMKQRTENKKQTTFAHTFAKAGAPDQMKMDGVDVTHLENNKMVSEGSQFGVQYFNQLMHE